MNKWFWGGMLGILLPPAVLVASVLNRLDPLITAIGFVWFFLCWGMVVAWARYETGE